MPDADAIIVIWFKLLCLAGKQNNSGVFLLNGRIPYTDEMFATIFRRPLNTVRLALKTFEEFGMVEIINNTVTIPNWEKHQKLDALEASREATRMRVATYRQKQKELADGCNVTSNVTEDVTVTLRNADRIDKNREDKSREDNNMVRFDDFWSVYPNKVKKKDARIAWKSLKLDSIADTIIDDVKRRCATQWKGKELMYVPHPTSYLHQRRWEDETHADAPIEQPRVYEEPDYENNW